VDTWVDIEILGMNDVTWRCGVEGDVKIRLRWEEAVDWRKERDGSDGRFRLDLETCQRKTASRPWLFKTKDELSARLQKKGAIEA
jgi:hypothetical protein